MFESFSFPSSYAYDETLIEGIDHFVARPPPRESAINGTTGSASSDDRLHFISAAVTAMGEEPAAIVARACEWARNEEHAFVTVDHVLFALVSRRSALSALNAAGVEAIGDLDDELVALVHRMTIPPLPAGQLPEIENAVFALLHHAQGHARRDGRSTWETVDLLSALRDAMRRSEFMTPGMLALQRRWPAAAEEKSSLDLLARIHDTQATQPGLMIDAVSRLFEPMARQADQERTVASLATTEHRIVQLLVQLREAQVRQTQAAADEVTRHLATISEKVGSLLAGLQPPRRKPFLQRAVPHLCVLAAAIAVAALGTWPLMS